ncbi:RidA family protein [Thalassorhabdomicrobium marinisediminis]|uniref:RidA family protein n=1 Tax=Thalassorhabdomicrobium marinisediminis TaxID=2170577 RepID=UPI00249136C7|nr:RidA family protein [Thalassorhabdomicrobium marinisediminis]
MSQITRIDTNARMSQVVIVNGIAHLAGQVGAEGGTVTEQTTEILEKIDVLLAKAGTDNKRLITAQIWCANMAEDFEEMNAVWDAWVPDGFAPARWTGEAVLATPGYRVEIVVTAAV